MLRGAASEAGRGSLLLLVVVAVGVRKWQASRLVCMTNGQTGAAKGLSGGPLVPLCSGGRTSVGPGLEEGPLTLLRGKHEMPGFRGHAFNFRTITQILSVSFLHVFVIHSFPHEHHSVVCQHSLVHNNCTFMNNISTARQILKHSAVLHRNFCIFIFHCVLVSECVCERETDTSTV